MKEMKHIDFSDLKRQADSIHVPDSLRDKIRSSCGERHNKSRIRISWKQAAAFVCVAAVLVSVWFRPGTMEDRPSLIVYAMGEDGQMHENVVNDEGLKIYSSVYDLDLDTLQPYSFDLFDTQHVSVYDFQFRMFSPYFESVRYTVHTDHAALLVSDEAGGIVSDTNHRIIFSADGKALCGSSVLLEGDAMTEAKLKIMVFGDYFFDQTNPVAIEVEYTYHNDYDNSKGSYIIYMAEMSGETDSSKHCFQVVCE